MRSSGSKTGHSCHIYSFRFSRHAHCKPHLPIRTKKDRPAAIFTMGRGEVLQYNKLFINSSLREYTGLYVVIHFAITRIFFIDVGPSSLPLVFKPAFVHPISQQTII